MSQAIFSDIVPGTTSGNELATILNDFKDAIASGMTGTVRPTNLQAGGAWIDTTTTLWLYKVYTGTADITVYSLNTVTNVASISSSSDLFSITKISDDDVPATLELNKERTTNNGQVEIADELGSVEFTGKDDAGTKTIGAKIAAVATNDFVPTQTGTDLVMYATDQSTTLLEEKARIVDSKFGIMTPVPENTLHVKGTGIRSERAANDAVGAKVILRKKRIAGTGASQLNDILAQMEFNSTDDDTVEILAAKIVSTATEAHTDVAHGNNLAFWIKKLGTTAFKEMLSLGEQVDIKDVLALNQQVDTTTTGSGQSITPVKSFYKVTNASLTSINNIAAPTDGKLIAIVNGTGASITIVNDSGGTAANRIRTGTTLDLTLADGASLIVGYDAHSSRWQVVGGSGGGGTEQTVATRQTGTSISAATGITPTVGVHRTEFVVGNGGEVTVTASPPITVSAMIVGQKVRLVGTSDTNTVTYSTGNNLRLNGDSRTLYKDSILDLVYLGSDGTNAAWVEESYKE